MKFRFSLRKRNDTEMKIKEKIKRKLLANNAASRIEGCRDFLVQSKSIFIYNLNLYKIHN